jgi:hypothetical protein
MNRAKMNYWVDVGIGFAGAISALSGLVFLLPGDLASGALGISYQTWNAVHTWSSLAAIAGVGAHLALHWSWMVAMTKQMLPFTSHQGAKQPASGLAYDGTEGESLSRRVIRHRPHHDSLQFLFDACQHRPHFDMLVICAGQ